MDANEFDNRRFWNERYRVAPEIGSGAGSRGYVVAYKRRLVGNLIANREIRSVLDVGCGDLCFHDEKLFADVDYEGIDIAEIVVERNRLAFPALRFRWHDVAAEPLGVTADLVICFDVLIHQLTADRFQSVLTNLIAGIGHTGLISYQSPPGLDGKVHPVGLAEDATPEEVALESSFQIMRANMPTYSKGRTAFHGELPDHVRHIDPRVKVEKVGAYRLQSVYLLTRA